jgi:cytochrome c biogenesis protein CcmG/thiol:disulfide interchange protein DsbE
MTVLSREVGSRIDAAASKLGQQARLLKILVWLLAIHAGFGFLMMAALGSFGVMGFLASREAAFNTRIRSDSAAMVGKSLPGFRLEDQSGTQLTNLEIEGKVVLLNFWATWCGPCRTEMPWFVEFQDRYRDSGFTVLAVSVDQQGWEVVRPFIEEQGLNFPVFVGDRDFGRAFGGVNVLPTTFIVDRTGKITARHRGLIDKSEYEKEIEALL